MNGAGSALAQAADALIGTPFRLHGRDKVTGLDCVGLVGAALSAIGRRQAIPRGYSLRNLRLKPFLPALESAGFIACHAPVEPGDLVLTHPSAGQIHVLIAAANTGFIHAHAGLGKVVRTPAPLDWPIISRWRLEEI